MAVASELGDVWVTSDTWVSYNTVPSAPSRYRPPANSGVWSHQRFINSWEGTMPSGKNGQKMPEKPEE